MIKSLDQKIANILANPSGAKDFILADAKDADMAGGMASGGKHLGSGRLRSLAEYRQMMREIVKQGLVDIMLMSASSSELLTIKERLFDGTAITPAVRANDTTDIHLLTGGTYAAQPSRPFRPTTTSISIMTCSSRIRSSALKLSRRDFDTFWKCLTPTPAGVLAPRTWADSSMT